MQSITPPPTPPGPAAEVSIILTGRDGRLRFTPEQRRKLLAAFDRGGQSAMAFARGHCVNCLFIERTWLFMRAAARMSDETGGLKSVC